MLSRALILMIAVLASPVYADTGGFSLSESWDGVWRGIQDRTGRLNPQGGLLQLVSLRQYPEYQMDHVVSQFPLADEDRWRRAHNGARVWIQSLDEFTLTNMSQLKLRTPMGESSHLGVRFDRVDDRDVRSGLLRIDFRFEPVFAKALYLELRFFPRWEKDDSDAEIVLGARWQKRGELRLRLFGLDPFINASYAIAESRDAVLEVHAWQDDWPLALALEVLSERLYGFRFEGYFGGVFETQTRYRYPEDEERNHAKAHSGILGGAMLEWRHSRYPLWIGATTLQVRTQSHAKGRNGVTDETIDESLSVNRIYAFGDVPGGFHIQASLRHRIVSSAHSLSGPSILSPDGTDLITDGRETGWIWMLLTSWTPKTGVGAELGLIRSRRTLDGQGQERGQGTDHRLVTRCVLQPGPKVWIRFGVGWDLDSKDGLYDGGGMTLIARF